MATMTNEQLKEQINLIFDEAKFKALAAVSEHLQDASKTEVPAPLVEATTERYVKALEAANYLGISERKLRQMVSVNRVPHHRVDGSLRFKLSELDEWSRVKLKLAG